MNVGEAGPRAPLRDGLRERLLAIRAAGLFGDIDEEAATLLTEHARIISFAKGDRITGLDRVVDTVQLVLEGSIRVGAEKGPALKIGPGRPVGLIGILSDTILAPSAIATMPTRTLAIPGDAFLAALEDNFSLWREALRLITISLLDTRGDLPPASDPVTDDDPTDTRPRLLVERALEISDAGLFAGANIDAVFDVARIMREIRVPAGHVFWRRGDTPTDSIRILSGSIRCTSANGESNVAGKTFLLGTVAASAKRPQTYEAVAETPVRAYAIAFEDWLVVLEAHPELAMKLLSNLATLLAKALEVKAFENPSVPAVTPSMPNVAPSARDLSKS